MLKLYDSLGYNPYEGTLYEYKQRRKFVFYLRLENKVRCLMWTTIQYRRRFGSDDWVAYRILD
jgi:hypothetical protein